CFALFQVKVRIIFIKPKEGQCFKQHIWGRGDANMLEGDSVSEHADTASTSSDLQEQETLRSHPFVKKMKAFLAGFYPWIHATQE
ncbi:hypothetical protein KI387_037975, partial [Taxus chinensis]